MFLRQWMFAGSYENPTDEDISFSLGCYKDANLAEWCLAELRKSYPYARVMLVSDGDNDPRYDELAKRFNCEMTYGERLYLTECGGKMIHRMLSLWHTKPTSYLIKIDTDTHIHRRLSTLPADECVFGTIQDSKNCYTSVQGGCVGFTKNLAERLYTSETFLDPALIDYRNTWASNEALLYRAEILGLMSFDLMIGYCSVKGRSPFRVMPHDEMLCRWKDPVTLKGREYAITHPSHLKYELR